GTPARSPRDPVGDGPLDLHLLALDELEGDGVGAGLLGHGGGDASDELGLLLWRLIGGDVELHGGHVGLVSVERVGYGVWTGAGRAPRRSRTDLFSALTNARALASTMSVDTPRP